MLLFFKYVYDNRTDMLFRIMSRFMHSLLNSVSSVISTRFLSDCHVNVTWTTEIFLLFCGWLACGITIRE